MEIDQTSRHALRRYYNRRRLQEAQRLTRPYSDLEKAVIERLIDRHAIPSEACVIDVGAGPGAYLEALGGGGRSVIAVDVADIVLRQLRSDVASNVQIVCADARQLPFRDGTAHFLLMAGPLYHLPDSDQRNLALREANRVLAPGGAALVVGLSRCGVLCGKAVESAASAARVLTYILSSAFRTGRLPADTLGEFAEAHLSSARVLGRECEEAGFRVVGRWGAQGGLAPLKHLVRLCGRVSPTAYKAVSAIAVATADSSLAARFSDHFVLELKK